MRKIGLGPDAKFDGKDYPVLALNFQTVNHIWIADPVLVQDLWVGKNALLDKDPESLIMFEDIIGQSFLFGHNDEVWKEKRKACAHAFYKERLVFMLETLKDKTMEMFEKWLGEIEASDNKTTVMDMATEFSDIFARNIIHVSFGEDISDDTIELMVRQGNTYVKKTMSIKEAIYVIIDQVCITHYTNVQNPINWLYPYIDKVFKLSSESMIVQENCRISRAWIKDYI